RERARRARLDAQAAHDAPEVVDLVDAAVPLAGRVPLGLGVVRALDVDGVRGAGPGAQLTADALLQAVRPPVQLVPPVEARRGRPLLLRVLDGHRLLEHVVEGDAEPLDGVQPISCSHWSPPWRRCCAGPPARLPGSAAGPAAAPGIRPRPAPRGAA